MRAQTGSSFIVPALIEKEEGGKKRKEKGDQHFSFHAAGWAVEREGGLDMPANCQPPISSEV